MPLLLRECRLRSLIIAFLCSMVPCGAALSNDMIDSGLAAGAKMRRLTEQQYRNTIADVFGQDIRVVGRFEPDMRADGLVSVGTSRVAVTPAGYQQYEQIALGIARQVVDGEHRPRLVGCAPASDDPKGRDCLRKVFMHYGMLLYRRPPTEPQLQALEATAQRAAATLGSFDAGIVAGLSQILTSPEFLFRIDAYQNDGMLDGWSRATRLSYFLWNTTPDQALLHAAGNGELATPDGYRQQLDRLLRSPRFELGVRSFFADFLHLDQLDTTAKDPLIYPRFVTGMLEAAREQTLRTITDTLLDRHLPYSALFTTRRMAMHRVLGPLYDIPVASKSWSFHEFPEGDPRAGLLTQVSFLAGHSHPGRTSPTLRGIAIREFLLCESIPAAPSNVSFTVIQDTDNPIHKTTRDRLQAHVDDAACAGCHRIMDPPGLALEHFDGIGRFRPLENGVEIDASGEIDGVAFQDAAGLGEVLGKNERVQRCLVSSAYRYALGRDLLGGEEAVIGALVQRFHQSGERLPELMEAIADSRAFRGSNIDGEKQQVAAGEVAVSRERGEGP